MDEYEYISDAGEILSDQDLVSIVRREFPDMVDMKPATSGGGFWLTRRYSTGSEYTERFYRTLIRSELAR